MMNKPVAIRSFCTLGLATLLGSASIAISASPDNTETPAAPTNLNVVTVSSAEVSLSWYDNSQDERGYYVQRSQDGLVWENLDTLDANSGEYRDVGLDPATRYTYRVFAFNARGESRSSNQGSAITASEQQLELTLNNF